MGSEIGFEPGHQCAPQPNSRRIQTLCDRRKWHPQKRANITLGMFSDVEEHHDYSLVHWQLSNCGQHCSCQLVSFDCQLRISMGRSNVDAIVKQYGLQTLPARQAITLG